MNGQPVCRRMSLQHGGSTPWPAPDHTACRAQGIAFVEEPRAETGGTVAMFDDLHGKRRGLIERARAALDGHAGAAGPALAGSQVHTP